MPHYLSVVYHIVDNLHQFIRFCQAEGLFPKPLRFITNNDDGCMVVFGRDILAQFVERPIDVLLLTSEKDPTRTRMKSPTIFLEPRRCVGFRIDANRNEKGVLP